MFLTFLASSSFSAVGRIYLSIDRPTLLLKGRAPREARRGRGRGRHARDEPKQAGLPQEPGREGACAVGFFDFCTRWVIDVPYSSIAFRCVCVCVKRMYFVQRFVLWRLYSSVCRQVVSRALSCFISFLCLSSPLSSSFSPCTPEYGTRLEFCWDPCSMRFNFVSGLSDFAHGVSSSVLHLYFSFGMYVCTWGMI